jgi:TRAP-type transport system periplasmic protein
MSKFLKSTFLVVLSLLVLAACGGGGGNQASTNDGGDSASASSDAKTINIGTTQTEDSVFAAALNKFKSEVEANTDNVDIHLHFNSEMGGEREMVEAVNIGTLEGVWTSTGVIANFVPEVSVVDLPFIFKDKEHARNVMNGEVGEELAEKLSTQNFKLLTWGENGFRHITNSKHPIEKPEDLEGLKIRTMEVKSHQEAFNALGADATPMAWGEVFTSLQQGVIDGQENPTSIIYSSKLNEVQKFVSLTGHVYSPTAMMINNDIWNGLSEENQKVLLDAAKAAQEENYTVGDANEEKYIEELKEAGMEFNEVDKEAFMKAVQPVVDEHKKSVEDLYNKIIESN